MNATPNRRRRPVTGATKGFADHEHRILLLQGGGALGAYQAGVYEGLASTGFAPDWVTGISIGAINAALIAGNPPERRIERLREFWHRVSGQSPLALPAGMAFARPFMNRMAAATAMGFGIPGFFTPRMPPPQFAPAGSLQALSFYDTEPLRATLEELVDFERIQRGDIRLSLGAVNVRSGESVYFDTLRDEIDASHVMASGALPPGFAPVEIDGESYIDGGIMSNTPLHYVAQDFRMDALIVQVDLFSGAGAMPLDIAQVQERVKDIQFQSKSLFSHAQLRQIESLRSALAELIAKLPAALRADPQVQRLAEVSRRGAISLLHLVNRHDTQSSNFKDYEFSRATVDQLWQAGIDDVQRGVCRPDTCHVTELGNGVRVFDLHPPAPQ